MAFSATHVTSKACFWRVRGHATAKIRMLHLAIYPSLSWCAGSRSWNRRELKQVRTVQLRMCRRALNFWPAGEETLQMLVKRSARWSERVMQEAKCRDGAPPFVALGMAPSGPINIRGPRMARRHVQRHRPRIALAPERRRGTASRPRSSQRYEPTVGRPNSSRLYRERPIVRMATSGAGQREMARA